MATAGEDVGSGTKRYSEAKLRTIATALELFAERGVRDTSLQMIADALGVTKAAVYHQFPSKSEIVLAVAEIELAKLASWVSEAEASGGTPKARLDLLGQVIDLAIERRGAVSMLQLDPEMVQFLGQHEPFQAVIVRLFAVLLGEESGPTAQAEAAMLSALIGGTVNHPFVLDLTPDQLRDEVIVLAKRLLQIP